MSSVRLQSYRQNVSCRLFVREIYERKAGEPSDSRRKYAKKAKIILPCLEDYETKAAAGLQMVKANLSGRVYCALRCRVPQQMHGTDGVKIST